MTGNPITKALTLEPHPEVRLDPRRLIFCLWINALEVHGYFWVQMDPKMRVILVF